MKKILTLIVTGAMMLAACDKAPKFQVEGTIEGAKDSMLYLTLNGLEGAQRLDSVKLKEDGTFSFKVTAPKDGLYEVYSATGTLLLKGTLLAGETELTLPATSGIYFIRTRQGDETATHKVLIF